MSKVAILIDGGYFFKRMRSGSDGGSYGVKIPENLNASKAGDITKCANSIAQAVDNLVNVHLDELNKIHHVSSVEQLLFRTYYYDATLRKDLASIKTPVSGDDYKYQDNGTVRLRHELFEILRKQSNLALRLGDMRANNAQFPWKIQSNQLRKLLKKKAGLDSLRDKHFKLDMQQKGVDMRIGLDIATIAIKKQADTIILVSGDADFIQAAKLARREGIRFILDPLWKEPPGKLVEHVDKVQQGLLPLKSKRELAQHKKNPKPKKLAK